MRGRGSCNGRVEESLRIHARRPSPGAENGREALATGYEGGGRANHDAEATEVGDGIKVSTIEAKDRVHPRPRTESPLRFERTDPSIEDIGWAVGYEAPSSFRPLFRRVTRVNPGAYRRTFQLPAPETPVGV